MMKNLRVSLFASKAKTPFEKSVLKATYPGNSEAPKEKHVQSILLALKGKNFKVTPEEAFSQLVVRLVDKYLPTILKTEVIVHRGIEKESKGYALAVSNLSHPIASDSSEMSRFILQVIQDYLSYIKSKATNYCREESSLLLEDTQLHGVSKDYLVKELNFLIAQFQSMAKLGVSCREIIKNYSFGVITNVVYWVLKDFKPLYAIISSLVTSTINRFSELTQQEAQSFLRILQEFNRKSEELKPFLGLRDSLLLLEIEIPEINEIPNNVIDSLGTSPYPHPEQPQETELLGNVIENKPTHRRVRSEAGYHPITHSYFQNPYQRYRPYHIPVPRGN